MGNQLCPANNKEILQNFKGIEKGDKSVSDLVVNYLAQRNSKDPSSLLAPEYDSKGELVFTHIKKFRPDGILKAFDSDSEASGNQRILDKHQHQQVIQEQEKVVVAEMILADGWRFEGETLKGVPEGKGEEHGPNGEYYKGQFQSGLKNGVGEYHHADGTIYRGRFKDNLMCGEGTIQFPNGDHFKGQFQDNVRQGKGKYTPRQPNIENLLYFQGNYSNDVKNGQGVMVFKEESVHGVWVQGRYDYDFGI